MRKPKPQKQWTKSYFRWPDGETYSVEHPAGTTVSDKEAQEAYSKLRAKSGITRNEQPTLLDDTQGSPAVPGVATKAGRTPRGGGQRLMLTPEEQQRAADQRNQEAVRLIGQRDAAQGSLDSASRNFYLPGLGSENRARLEAEAAPKIAQAKAGLSAHGFDPNVQQGNTLDRAGALLLNRIVPVGTPESDRLSRMPLSEGLRLSPPGGFWETSAPGMTQEIAKTPGVLGAARQFAAGLLTPTNAALTLGTMGLPALSPLARAAALRLAPSAYSNPALQPLVRGLSLGSDLASAAPQALGGYFAGQGGLGAVESALDTQTLESDPAKYGTTLALNTLMAVLGARGAMPRRAPVVEPDPFASRSPFVPPEPPPYVAPDIIDTYSYPSPETLRLSPPPRALSGEVPLPNRARPAQAPPNVGMRQPDFYQTTEGQAAPMPKPYELPPTFRPRVGQEPVRAPLTPGIERPALSADPTFYADRQGVVQRGRGDITRINAPLTTEVGPLDNPNFVPRTTQPSRTGVSFPPVPPTPTEARTVGTHRAQAIEERQSPAPPAPGSVTHTALSTVAELTDLLGGALESKEASRAGAVRRHYKSLQDALAPLRETLPNLRRTKVNLQAGEQLSALMNRLEARYGSLSQYHPENTPDVEQQIRPAAPPAVRRGADEQPARDDRDPFADRTGDLVERAAESASGLRAGTGEAARETLPERAARPEVAPVEGADQTETHTYGKEGVAYTPRNREVKFKYALVPLDNLITSHTAESGALLPNDRYDQRLQNRDRERAGSVEQISNIAGQLNPKRLLDNASVSEGAPVVGADNMVEGGNGRVLALRKAFGDPQKKRLYEGEVLARAKDFGLDSETVARMQREGQNPILVRVRQGEITPEERAELAKEMNEATAQRLSPSETALSDGTRLRESGALELYRPNAEGDITTRANQAFTEAFLQKVSAPSERNALVNSRGELTPEGRRRIENAMAAAAYRDADLLDLLTESDETRRVRSAILATAPKMSQLIDRIGRGERYDLDITKDIADAAKVYASLKRAGKSVEEYLRPTTKELFEDEAPKPLSQVGQRLLEEMEAARHSGKRLADLLDAYIDTANAAGNPKQSQALVPKPPPRILEVMQVAKELAKNEGTQPLTFEEPDTQPAGDQGQSAPTGERSRLETPRTGAAARRTNKEAKEPAEHKRPARRSEALQKAETPAAPLTRQAARDLARHTLVEEGKVSGAQIYKTAEGQHIYRDPDGNQSLLSLSAAKQKLQTAERAKQALAEAKASKNFDITLSREEAQTAATDVSDELADKLFAPYEGKKNPPRANYSLTPSEIKEIEKFANAKEREPKLAASLKEKLKAALSELSLGTPGGKVFSDILEAVSDAALGKIKSLLPDVAARDLATRVSNYFLDGWAGLEKEAPQSAAKATHFAAANAYADTLAKQLLPKVLEPLSEDNRLRFQTYLVQDAIEALRDRLTTEMESAHDTVVRLTKELNDRTEINAYRNEKDFKKKRKMADERDKKREAREKAQKTMLEKASHRQKLSILDDPITGNPLVTVNADGTLKSDARLRGYFRAEGVDAALRNHKSLVEPLLEENFVSSGYEASGIKGKYSDAFTPKTAVDENGEPIGLPMGGNGGLKTPKMRLGAVPGAKEFTGKAEHYMDSYTEAVTMRLRGGYRARFEREMYQQWIADGIALEPKAKTPDGDPAIRRVKDGDKTRTEGYFNGKWEPASEYVIRTDATRSTVDRSLPTSLWMPNRLFHEVEALRDVYRPTVLSSYFENLTDNLIHAFMIGFPDTLFHSAALVGRLANAKNSIMPKVEGAGDAASRLPFLRSLFSAKNTLKTQHADAERARAERFAAKNGVMPPSYSIEITKKEKAESVGEAARQAVATVYEVTGVPLYGKRGVWINTMATLTKWVDEAYLDGNTLGSDTPKGAEVLRREMQKMNTYITARKPLVQKWLDKAFGGWVGTFYQTGMRNRANFFQQPALWATGLFLGAAGLRILMEKWAEETGGAKRLRALRNVTGILDRTIEYPTKVVANAARVKRQGGTGGDIAGKMTADVLNFLYQPVASGPLPAAFHRYIDHYPSLTPKRVGVLPLSKRPPNDAGWMDWRRLLATGIEGSLPILQQWPVDMVVPEPLNDTWEDKGSSRKGGVIGSGKSL